MRTFNDERAAIKTGKISRRKKIVEHRDYVVSNLMHAKRSKASFVAATIF